MARSTVARSRSSSKKTNRLAQVLNSTGASLTLTLSAILSDLKFSYDLTLGTLNGDAVRSPPNLDNLSLLRKSLNNLKLQLEKTIADDVVILEKIDEQLQSKEDARGTKRSFEEDTNEDTPIKALSSQMEDDDDEDGPLSKKKRPKHEVISMESAGEDLKDDDDIPLAAVRTNHRVGINTITERILPQSQQPQQSQQLTTENVEVVTNLEDELEEEFHTPEGDHLRVKNPKSEFVTLQTLPAAAALLGLFSEEDGGLDQTGEEYLKKKYAVASYPTRDLQDLLPGPVPDIDFSKSKPSNQVQFTTFQSYTDIYFRPYSEEDIKFLKEKYVISTLLGKNYDPLLHPFFIPKLGPLYLELWSQEEPLNGVKLSTPSQARVSADNIMPKGSLDQLTDELLETDTVSCGPLVSRLLSALIPDQLSEDSNGLTGENYNDINDNNNNSNDSEHDKKLSSSALEDQQGWSANIVQADYSQLEQRLRRELKYVGVYMNVNQTLKDVQASLTGSNNNPSTDNPKIKDEFQEDWITGKEDDEVCTEMRSLQRELSKLTRKNNKRKQILIPLVEEQIAWQEYMSILDDLDKQIDQAYLKRMRVPKKLKKRGHSQQQAQQQLTPSAMAAQQLQQLQQAAANSGLKSLLDKRNRWINKIGPLFKTNELMRRFPKDSVFQNVDLSKEDEDNEEVDDGTSGINNDTNGGELIDE